MIFFFSNDQNRRAAGVGLDGCPSDDISWFCFGVHGAGLSRRTQGVQVSWITRGGTGRLLRCTIFCFLRLPSGFYGLLLRFVIVHIFCFLTLSSVGGVCFVLWFSIISCFLGRWALAWFGRDWSLLMYSRTSNCTF
jgi:hypothetical protein